MVTLLEVRKVRRASGEWSNEAAGCVSQLCPFEGAEHPLEHPEKPGPRVRITELTF